LKNLLYENWLTNSAKQIYEKIENNPEERCWIIAEKVTVKNLKNRGGSHSKDDKRSN
jgi:hypothetical protein